MKRPDHLVIYLSGGCNLRCPYCYAAGLPRAAIKPGALAAAIDAFCAAAPAAVRFTFLGGEPLLERGLLKAALRRIRRLRPAATVHVFTNGVALRRGEAAALLGAGVSLTVSLHSAAPPRAVMELPAAVRGRMSASWLVTPERAASLADDVERIAALGFGGIAWAPDIKASWGGAALRALRLSSAGLLARYLRRLKAGRGVWELANGYEAVALAARGERPGPCRNLALAPDGYFYPCDKMLSAPAAALRPFRVRADGSGRGKFFALARAAGVRCSQSGCGAGPWAAARFAPVPGRAPRGQAAARAAASGWLAAAAAAGLASPVFRRIHGI